MQELFQAAFTCSLRQAFADFILNLSLEVVLNFSHVLCYFSTKKMKLQFPERFLKKCRNSSAAAVILDRLQRASVDTAQAECWLVGL